MAHEGQGATASAPRGVLPLLAAVYALLSALAWAPHTLGQAADRSPGAIALLLASTVLAVLVAQVASGDPVRPGAPLVRALLLAHVLLVGAAAGAHVLAQRFGAGPAWSLLTAGSHSRLLLLAGYAAVGIALLLVGVWLLRSVAPAGVVLALAGTAHVVGLLALARGADEMAWTWASRAWLGVVVGVLVTAWPSRGRTAAA